MGILGQHQPLLSRVLSCLASSSTSVTRRNFTAPREYMVAKHATPRLFGACPTFCYYNSVRPHLPISKNLIRCMRYLLGINHTIYNFSDDMHTASTAKAVFMSPASSHCIFLLSTSAVCALSDCHRRRGVGDNSAGAYWLWDAHLCAVFCVMEVRVRFCVCTCVC